MKLHFACFKGSSLSSRLIRFWTRSDSYSHTGYVDEELGLMETWRHGGSLSMWWDVSDFSEHKEGTELEIWQIEIDDKVGERVRRDLLRLAMSRVKYDYWGVAGFVLKGSKHSKQRRFCSEGCIEGLARWMAWDRIKADQVSPQSFVEIIQAAGGRCVWKGKVENGDIAYRVAG